MVKTAKLKKLDIVSFGKLNAALGFLFSALFGLGTLLLSLLGGLTGLIIGLLTAIGFVIGGIIGGFISGVISALIFNLLSDFVDLPNVLGGIFVEVEE